ncbi:MAG: tetratricopeptide repeat protein, partial [Acidobacteriota bacterium]
MGVSLLWSALAAAEPKTADEWYKEGENQYNLGEFDKAADAFKQGFALETDDAKKPAFLYNVAQAYRQGNKCKDAVFFYKRFLSLKDTGVGKPLSDDKHKEIEGLIAELDACAKNQEAIAKKPPENTMSPSGDSTGKSTGTTGTAGTTTATGTKVANAGDEGGDEGDEGGVRKGITLEPKLVTGRLGLGASFVSAGNLDIPVQPNFTLIGGYPIKLIPKLRA